MFGLVLESTCQSANKRADRATAKLEALREVHRETTQLVSQTVERLTRKLEQQGAEFAEAKRLLTREYSDHVERLTDTIEKANLDLAASRKQVQQLQAELEKESFPSRQVTADDVMAEVAIGKRGMDERAREARRLNQQNEEDREAKAIAERDALLTDEEKRSLVFNALLGYVEPKPTETAESVEG